MNIKILQESLKEAGFYSGSIDGILGNNTKEAIKELQRDLRKFGFYWKRIDGDYGKGTKEAVKKLQNRYAQPETGLLDKTTAKWLKIELDASKDIDGYFSQFQKVPSKELHKSIYDYPQETRSQKEIREFYGQVGRNQTKIILPYKMKLAWDLSKKVSRITVHKKVADSVQNIFEETLKVYGKDGIEELKLDLYGGSLNIRKMRGANRYSLHSWGIAIDLAPQYNTLHMHKDTALFAKKEYDRFWGIVENNGGYSLLEHCNYDGMHFQFAWRDC